MWKKWGPVIVFGFLVALLLAGTWFFYVKIKAESIDRLDALGDQLAIIESGLADIRAASDNIAAGIGRIQDGLDAYEVGYYASLEGFGASLDAILGNYEKGLNGRIEQIKSGK